MPKSSARKKGIQINLARPHKLRKKILVVGDWVVDEHWVTSIHRSKTRSRTGTSHHRSIQEPTGCVITLAGAGKTASVLYEATSDVEGKLHKPYEIIGAGIWNSDDQSTLAHLLTPGKAVGHTHHRLTYPYPQAKDHPEAVHLFNLGTADESDPVCMTTRVIRLYQQTGQEYVLQDRIDWELPHAGKRKLKTKLLDEQLKRHLHGLDAIIIKDMAKGVVDDKLISWLAEACIPKKAGGKASPGPAWFVSSKTWEPDWYRDLPRDAVRLLIVPQVAAYAAFEKSGFSRWITGDQSVTREGLDRINKLAARFSNALICVLPIGLQVIARADCSDKKAHLFRQPVAGEGLHAVGMPMASVFLPTMVSLLLEHDARLEKISKEECQEILVSALSFTDAWMREEVKRITEAKTWQDNLQKLVLSDKGLRPSDRDDEHPLLPRWTRVEWDESVGSWEKAYEVRGVIPHENPTPHEYGVLETRRAMVEVNGYVCCVESKRQVLRLLNREMQQFHPDFGNWKAFMLKASPGAGKSYLVNKLAESHGFGLLQFNITSLVTRNDLLDCFDTIVTTQAREKGKKFLVFFDEIDSDLDQHSVYDAFLRPLEEGLYVRAGKAFYIGPCIWIFAGTRDPASSDPASKEHRDQQAAAKKGSDFVSRLSALPLQFDVTPSAEFENDALERLENVYAGATLLKRHFPDVTHVSEAVLDVFRVIKPTTGVRKIDRFVRNLDEVQYGLVSMKNVPEWKTYLGVTAKGVSNWDKDSDKLEQRMIRIV